MSMQSVTEAGNPPPTVRQPETPLKISYFMHGIRHVVVGEEPPELPADKHSWERQCFADGIRAGRNMRKTL